MNAHEMFPPELAGKRDLDYITPQGRRLTEYEAVTCYTQAQVDGGGLQVAGYSQLRPDGRPLFDPASTRLRCADWFAYRDPNQMWQRPYYVAGTRAEQAIERATEVAISTGAVRLLSGGWVEDGLVGAYFPFGHYEYGLFRALNVAARDSLSDVINNVLAFNAADKLRHAQGISILGLDLESALVDFDGTRGREIWLTHPDWQPLRRLIEETMAILDWGEIIVAVDLVLEPLIGEPLRRLVFALTASAHRDLIMPVMAATASADWHRTARAIRELVGFLLACSGGEDNAGVLAEWLHRWQERATPVAEALFAALGAALNEPDLAGDAKAATEDELRRAGADQINNVPAHA
jgi:methane monooxygenase component A beta chain/propane monooxygenase small subunit